MKKHAITVIILCCAMSIFAQETSSAAASNDENLFAFDLNLAPNTTGALEGRAELGILYSPWIYSSVGFSVTNFTSVYDDNGGSTTSVESTKNFDIDVIRTRPDFLKWNFAGDDFYAALNGRILLNIKWINQEKYGYIDPGTVSLFYTQEDAFNFYPFGGGDVEVRLGPVLLTGYFMGSLAVLYSTVTGEYYYSNIIPAMTAPVAYSLQDRGFEIRAGGMAMITPIKEVEIKYSFDYIRHRGYSYGYQGATAAEFVYEGEEMKHSLSLSIDMGDYRPMIGASYIAYAFKPLPIYSIQPYTNARWGFLFGVTYK